MKTSKIDGPNGAVAVHESRGRGEAIVLLHSNSASSRGFARQIDGPLGEKFRIIGVDLPGHGQSDDAKDGAYALRSHAQAVHAVVDKLMLSDACFVGWSLGGHVVLEMAPDLPKARGFMVFGTPPLGFPPRMDDAFLPNPAMALTFAPNFDRDQAATYVASFFRRGFPNIPEFFIEDALRTDGRARAQLPASLAPGRAYDEIVVAGSLKAPLAVLHGAEERLVNGAYFRSIPMPTLWRGTVQGVPGAGHSPQWETPQTFNALLEGFMRDTR